MPEQAPEPGPVDRAEWQERVDRLTELFGSMIETATVRSTYRCPYKNRFDQCTAQFGCRNQRKPRAPGELKVCGGDDKIDYRSAWETGAA